MKTVVLKREKNHQDNLEITIILAIDGNWIPFVINTPSLITQLQRMEAEFIPVKFCEWHIAFLFITTYKHKNSE